MHPRASTCTSPGTLTLSLYHKLDAQWALLASLNWQDWSRSITQDANYRDTWHASLATQYRFDPRWLWSLGVAYDSSPVDDEDRTLSTPLDETWRLGTGLTYALDERTDLNLSYELVWMGDMPIDQQKSLPARDPKRTSGEFEDAWVQALSASATWRF